MNYRQWKKNYKKKHGYNPPLEEDKRKQVKLLKKSFYKLDLQKAVKDVVNAYTKALANGLKIIGEALINVGNSLEIK